MPSLRYDSPYVYNVCFTIGGYCCWRMAFYCTNRRWRGEYSLPPPFLLHGLPLKWRFKFINNQLRSMCYSSNIPVYGWGRGEHGRLGFGDNDKSSKMVPQKVHLLAGEDIVQVSCGGTHSVALTRDGRMYSFGRGDHGRLGYGRKVTTGQPMEVPIGIPPRHGTADNGHWIAKLVACGGRHTLAIVEWKADDESES
ncbi:hypothetical protein C1H46_030522 [Malus baccata]|uniref:Regulator of chromosome condensation 1/beta-lactamase-inhibitor protein II n=1 Tax=Malus baccata TaxID=106549 RepID=A0A540LBU3_MALBA|nr:hypothetical protein C1H46_030522 [Malus baccata]